MCRVTLVLLVAWILIPAAGCAPAVIGESDGGQARQFVVNGQLREERLIPGKLHGCVLVPAKGVIQRLVTGFERTGESCSVTVRADNTVQVSFLGDSIVRLVSTGERSADVLLGPLGKGQVLVVQHHRGEVVSVTQTVYDRDGNLVYGRSGRGDIIRECHLGMMSAETLAGRKDCTR